MYKRNIFIITLTSLFIILTSCGGDDSSSPVSTESTGVFLDGPVVNIGYKTDTKEGVTNPAGEYDYLPGESVTFFIGDLVFPTVKASGVVTPLELAGATDTSDPTVVNMIRLLQTLDENADHSDGIQITEAAITAATQVDFNLSVAEFEASPAVISLITSVGATELISEAEAIQNFEETLYEIFSVNLTEITATSVVTTNEPGCEGLKAGFNYTFTDTTMTRIGSDGFDSDGSTCTVTPDETQSIVITDLAADFDIPFNCVSYPVCTSDDFNKTIVSEDEGFTATYTHNPITNVITYVYEQSGRVVTEIITINEFSDAETVSGNFNITETVTQDDREIIYGSGYTLYCGGDLSAFDGSGTQIVSDVGKVFEFTDMIDFNSADNTFTIYWNDDGSGSTGSYDPSTGVFSLSEGPYLDDSAPSTMRFEYIYSLNGAFNSEAKTFAGTYTEETTGTYLPTSETVECSYAATFEGVLQ